jgi:xylan 1,4-beta-xylosidase
MRLVLAAIFLAAFACVAPAGAQTMAGAAVPVTITVDGSRIKGDLPPVWRFFGADEPNYATMTDGRKLLAGLGELRPGQVYFRAHNLLNTGDGTPAFKWGSTNAYTETKDGKPIYDWTIVDRIIDTYRERGIRPYLQIGFMPEALSSAPAGTPYQHSWRPGFAYDLIVTGWAYPPKDYGKWAELVYQWTLHNVQRYGRSEVERWYFEVWNEANLPLYWKGSPEEFYKMHDYAIDAVRRALPTARVGGPDVAGSARPDRDASFHTFMEGFLAHVARGKNYATGKTGTPTDFLSFHAKGAPTFVDGHVRMGISTHLKAVDNGFIKIAGVPELAKKPIVIGESDPEGCAACPGPQNAYRNGTMYSSYTAASFARIWEMARRRNVNLEGVLTWAFTFESQPWFAGYRQLATNGIDLPVMNVFRLFSKLGPSQLVSTSSAEIPLDKIMAEGVREAADVSAIATRDSNGRLAILIWNYHDDDVAGPDAAVRLALKGIGGGNRNVTVWRVDGANANAFAAWKKMGAPQSLDANQYRQLESASRLTPEPSRSLAVNKGAAEFDITVPRQGVLLVTLEK